jgi:hypothetical protein
MNQDGGATISTTPDAAEGTIFPEYRLVYTLEGRGKGAIEAKAAIKRFEIGPTYNGGVSGLSLLTSPVTVKNSTGYSNSKYRECSHVARVIVPTESCTCCSVKKPPTGFTSFIVVVGKNYYNTYKTEVPSMVRNAPFNVIAYNAGEWSLLSMPNKEARKSSTSRDWDRPVFPAVLEI